MNGAPFIAFSSASAVSALGMTGFLPSTFQSSALNGGGCCLQGIALEQPYSSGHESLPFLFTLDDEAKGHGLDASGGDAAFDVFPEERGDLVSHEAVEHAAGLLGVEQVDVEVARVIQRLMYGTGGDFVELDTLDVRILVLQEFGDVPRDGFPFAVGVGGEEDGVHLEAASRRDCTTFSLPWMISYSGAKSLASSTPMLLLGRSRIWPTLACTR